jgi:CMP-N,N'-diacetyllegionaminic acid synthase
MEVIRKTAATMACVIPARLGSKRIARKNLRLIGGKPLLAHSINAALSSELFDTVYVCTESEEIAATAIKHGAEARVVSEELCTDFIPSWKPCVALLDQLNSEGANFSDLLCLQPTSPLRSAEDIRSGVKAFRDEGCDFVLSVTEIDPHYFHWALLHEEGWKMVFGDDYMIERPLLPSRYRPNGSIKVANVDALRRTGHFFGKSLSCIQTPEERSVHVGVEFEFRLADFLLQGGAR